MEGKRAILKRREDTEQVALDTPEPCLDKRDCSRCDGYQYLLAADNGFGKYRCDTCQMVVGFDLEATPAEFIIDRGIPGHYTKNLFGPLLSVEEQRLP